MLNTVRFDPGQRSLFVMTASLVNTTERRPLLAGNKNNNVHVHVHVNHKIKLFTFIKVLFVLK